MLAKSVPLGCGTSPQLWLDCSLARLESWAGARRYARWPLFLEGTAQYFAVGPQDHRSLLWPKFDP